MIWLRDGDPLTHLPLVRVYCISHCMQKAACYHSHTLLQGNSYTGIFDFSEIPVLTESSTKNR